MGYNISNRRPRIQTPLPAHFPTGMQLPACSSGNRHTGTLNPNGGNRKSALPHCPEVIDLYRRVPPICNCSVFEYKERGSCRRTPSLQDRKRLALSLVSTRFRESRYSCLCYGTCSSTPVGRV